MHDPDRAVMKQSDVRLNRAQAEADHVSIEQQGHVTRHSQRTEPDAVLIGRLDDRPHDQHAEAEHQRLTDNPQEADFFAPEPRGQLSHQQGANDAQMLHQRWHSREPRHAKLANFFSRFNPSRWSPVSTAADHTRECGQRKAARPNWKRLGAPS